MNTTAETTSTQAGFGEYAKYAATGALIHPLLAGFVSILFGAFDYFMYGNESTVFFSTVIMLGLIAGFPVCIALFILTGVFYSVAFGVVYNNTLGKALPTAKKFQHNLIFSIIMSFISPVIVYILFTISN
jgi:hypothetical protein